MPLGEGSTGNAPSLLVRAANLWAGTLCVTDGTLTALRGRVGGTLPAEVASKT